MRGQVGIIDSIIALVLGVVGVTIVKDIIDNQSYTGTLATVTDNIPLFMGLGLLALGATAFFIGRSKWV